MRLTNPGQPAGRLVAGKALGAAFLAVLFVAVCFAVVVRGGDRRNWLLVAVGLLGCVAAAAFGVFAMLHK